VDAQIDAGTDTDVIDCTGKTLMPGLIDTHVHATMVDEIDLQLFLGAGVTTARDVGGKLEKVIALRGRVNSGAVLGPRLFVCGPLIGGYITDNFGWPWIFYINIPLGIVAGTIIWTSLAHTDKAGPRIPVDGTGMLLLAVVVIMLQLVLDKGHEFDWFTSPGIRLMLNVAIIAGIAFYLWERREPHTIIDYSLFR
jgi:MFS family permease